MAAPARSSLSIFVRVGVPVRPTGWVSIGSTCARVMRAPGAASRVGERDRIASALTTVHSDQHVVEHRRSSKVVHDVSIWPTDLDAIGAAPGIVSRVTTEVAHAARADLVTLVR